MAAAALLRSQQRLQQRTDDWARREYRIYSHKYIVSIFSCEMVEVEECGVACTSGQMLSSRARQSELK